MSAMIQIDRFTRMKQSVSGTFTPAELPRLIEYLVSDEGKITYSLVGSEVKDAAGSQKRCVKCIISGWFLLSDPVSLQPDRHELVIESKLVIVRDEADMPPLEMEADDEDYIVCGAEMDVMERVEEEILLALPAVYAGHAVSGADQPVGKATKSAAIVPAPSKTAKISPFAKLAELTKKQSN